MKEVVIYTDGSCEGNPGPGGYAAIVDIAGEREEITGGEPQTTNNRMEMMAIVEGLKAVREPSRIRVVTDSQYVVNGMKSWIHGWRRRGWKTAAGAPVKNKDLWERLSTLAQGHKVSWEWVKGHAGHPENERADTLAKEAIREAMED